MVFTLANFEKLLNLTYILTDIIEEITFFWDVVHKLQLLQTS